MPPNKANRHVAREPLGKNPHIEESSRVNEGARMTAIESAEDMTDIILASLKRNIASPPPLDSEDCKHNFSSMTMMPQDSIELHPLRNKRIGLDGKISHHIRHQQLHEVEDHDMPFAHHDSVELHSLRMEQGPEGCHCHSIKDRAKAKLEPNNRQAETRVVDQHSSKEVSDFKVRLHQTATERIASA